MGKSKTVKFKKLSPLAKPFSYTRGKDACMDMYALENVYVTPGETVLVKTGIAVEIPEGYEGIVRGRSGLALKGISIHVGTVEEAYRGDVGIILTNTNPWAYTVEAGTRVAQFTIKPVTRIELEEIDILSTTERGDGAYGSSGI